MAKISINLLPPEIRTEELKQAKFYKIQFVGVAIILTMTFLSSLTVALRILQSRNITEAQASLKFAEQQVTDLKTTQASLLLLKSRLTVIDQYFGQTTLSSSMYKLLDKLIPPSTTINAVSIDKSGQVVFLALVPDSIALDTLMNNLTKEESNEGKISQVTVENLNRGRDGLYRVSFKIKPK